MTERKTVWKWFWAWDFEKEEKWLNEMAMQGWALSSVAFCSFTFKRSEPGEYIIRLEMRDHDDAYVSFMEDTGAEYIGRVVKWIYFRRKSALGSFDIFSDIDSKLTHLKTLRRMLLLIGLGNLLIGFGNSLNASHLGWINLILASLLMYGCGIVTGKIEYLENERAIRE